MVLLLWASVGFAQHPIAIGTSSSSGPAGGCTDSLSPGAQTITWTAGHTYCPNAVGTYTFASAQAVNVNNVTIYCSNPGMLLLESGAVNLFIVTGNSFRVRGCTLDKSSGAGGAIFDVNADDFTAEWNIIQNGGTNSGRGWITGKGGARAKIRNNVIHGGGAAEWLVNFISDTAAIADPDVSFNDIDGVADAQKAIAFNKRNAFNLSGAKAIGNDIRGIGTCIYAVAENIADGQRNMRWGLNGCTNTATSGNEGFSIFGAIGAALFGNTFDDGGNFKSTFCAYSLNDAYDTSWTGNVVKYTNAFNPCALILLDSGRNTISGGSFGGMLTDATHAAVYISTSAGSASTSDNVFIGLTINLRAASAGPAMWLDCDSTSSVCNNNSFIGDHISGDSTAGQVGVKLTQTIGTTSDTHISDMHLTSLPTGVSIASGVSDTTLGIFHLKSVATPISDSGTRTLPQYVHLTAQTNNIAATTAYAVQANGGGRYRACATAAITTAAGTSSTLPNVNVIYTDADDSVVKTAPITASSAANTIGTASASCAYINAKASTNIQYSTTNYASNAANAMNYNLNFTLYRETQ
jgi:hypothetical protein